MLVLLLVLLRTPASVPLVLEPLRTPVWFVLVLLLVLEPLLTALLFLLGVVPRTCEFVLEFVLLLIPERLFELRTKSLWLFTLLLEAFLLANERSGFALE